MAVLQEDIPWYLILGFKSDLSRGYCVRNDVVDRLSRTWNSRQLRDRGGFPTTHMMERYNRASDIEGDLFTSHLMYELYELIKNWLCYGRRKG